MISLVLDASVAAKWYLPDERLTGEAVGLLAAHAGGRCRFLAPDLFWPELGNILWKALRMGRISRSSAEEALAAAQEQGISTFPSGPLVKDALAIAASFDRTVHDGMYVALALAAGTKLITADERLVSSLGLQFPVQWLGSFTV